MDKTLCPMCGKTPCACPRWGGMIEGMNKDELAAYDFGCRSMEGALRAILDGEDRGEGVSHEPWESLRRRVLALAGVDATTKLMRTIFTRPGTGCEACDGAVIVGTFKCGKCGTIWRNGI